MNFNLSQIPVRTSQPRTSGLTMIMDKGLSINEVHNFMSVGGPHSDVIKLGFGTSFVTPNLKQKIEAYQSYNIPLYFGGTLFEAFLAKHFTILSEVGSKDAAHIIPPYKWIELMRAELEAGATYVIAEAREAGNVGIYRGSGEVREGLVQEILTQIPEEKIIWEAPQKAQQLYFLELIGCNVNLGNIPPHEIIALEAMRIGLRGDTFELYLNK